MASVQKKVLLVALAAGAVGLIALAVLVYRRGVDRVLMGVTLFHGAEQYENFNRAAKLFPASTMAKARRPSPFPAGEPAVLPATFVFHGVTIKVTEFLKETDTSALLVLKDGKIRHEHYALTADQMRTGCPGRRSRGGPVWRRHRPGAGSLVRASRPLGTGQLGRTP